MDMKKLLGIVSNNAQLNESINECGDMVQQPQTPPVTMSVNLNAQGVDNIKELLGLMTRSEQKVTTEPVPMSMPTPGMPSGAPAMADLIKIASSTPDEFDKDNAIDVIAKSEKPVTDAVRPEKLANAPDEEYADVDAIVANGDDMHRAKTQYKRAQPGDNPMATEAIKSDLMKLYNEIKEAKEKPVKSKKAKKDYDGDGKIESEKDEV